MRLWKGQSCWKKGCVVYCVLALLGIPIYYFAWQIMKGNPDHNEAIHLAAADAEAPNTRKPQTDVEYIDVESGDVWGFAIGTSGEDSDPINVAWYRGNGMQGRQLYEMRATTSNCYDLYEEGNEESSYTVYIYESTDSILVSTKTRSQLFVTADASWRAISGIDLGYTPERYAMPYGKDGGKWDYLQSGEVAYVFPSGVYARSTWVKDGDKLYYVDVSGCRMLNNWAYDGFYAGSDGTWDRTVRVIDRNVLPGDGVYSDASGKQWTFKMHTMEDGTIYGEAHLEYPKNLDFREDFNVHSFGNSAYWLAKRGDEFVTWHVVVLDDGLTIRVSGAGVTEEYKRKL